MIKKDQTEERARVSSSMNPTDQSRAATAAFSVKTGDTRIGRKLHIGSEEVSVKISSRDTNGAFAVLAGLVAPKGGPPLHRHLSQDEWFYIVDGQFLFEVDGNSIHAGACDTVFLPHGSRHTLQNVGGTAGRTVVTVVPGGLDLFFEELSMALPPGADPNPATLGELFQKHGLELLGPPMSKRKAA
jgi:quercetin dioxygenase-like cupin family protein